MNGCEIVCPCPMSNGRSAWDSRWYSSGTKNRRGTRPNAARTHGSRPLGVAGFEGEELLPRSNREPDRPLALSVLARPSFRHFEPQHIDVKALGCSEILHLDGQMMQPAHRHGGHNRARSSSMASNGSARTLSAPDQVPTSRQPPGPSRPNPNGLPSNAPRLD